MQEQDNLLHEHYGRRLDMEKYVTPVFKPFGRFGAVGYLVLSLFMMAGRGAVAVHMTDQKQAPSGLNQPSNPKDRYWLGAKLHPLSGEDYSALGIRKADGGIALISVAEDSDAAKAGLKENDLIQAVNGTSVPSLEFFVQLISKSGAAPLVLTVVRNQQTIEVTVSSVPYIEIETSHAAREFKKLPLPSVSAGTVSVNNSTDNDPLTILIDCRLTKRYGAIYRNGIHDGAYKLDLGTVKSVVAITSWSYGVGARGRQNVMIYGCSTDADPGWDLSKFTPLGALDTGDMTGPVFTAASLRAVKGQTLGAYRWIIWAVSPVTSAGGGENSAFQELSVELAH